MKIDSRAGQLAIASDLVDVSKLIDAYYEEQPEPHIPEQCVVFGTSGHRGSSFKKTFNEWHILAITQAICLYRKQHKIDGPLFLGIDSEPYAELSAELGDSLYRRSEASATNEQKAALEHITAKDMHAADLAGEKPITIMTKASGDGNLIGGIKVVAANGWFAARPSGTEAIYKITRKASAAKSIWRSSRQKRRPWQTRRSHLRCQ